MAKNINSMKKLLYVLLSLIIFVGQGYSFHPNSANYLLIGSSKSYNNELCVVGNYIICYGTHINSCMPNITHVQEVEDVSIKRPNLNSSWSLIISKSDNEGKLEYVLKNGSYQTFELTQNWTAHTPCIIAPSSFKVTRWERSIDNGVTWEIIKNVDFSDNMDVRSDEYQEYHYGETYLYEETDPSKGTYMYRILKSDGSYEHVTTIHYYDQVQENINIQQGDMTKTVDDNFTLTLDVKDNNDNSYQWYHNGVAIKGANTSIYTVDAVKSTDAGVYYCKISNPASYTDSAPIQITVNKCAQQIYFPEITAKVYGDSDFELPSQTDKGLIINYQSSNPNVATIHDNIVHIVGAGETIITANQLGNSDYLEAQYVSRKLIVNKRMQSITFDKITPKTYGDLPFYLPEFTDEGLSISYTSLNPKVATIQDNKVTILNAGSTEIIASQAGDATHYEAPTKSQTLLVNKASQKINFEPIPDKTYGDTQIILNSVTDKGLPITYSADTDIIKIEDYRITILKPGIANVIATQDGNENFLSAESIIHPIKIKKAPQTINLDKIPELTFGDDLFCLPETSDKGLIINYATSDASIVKVVGNKLIICGAGNAEITATQEGNEYYLSASPVTKQVVVLKAYQNIAFDKIPDHTFGDAPFELTASAQTSKNIRFESSNTNIATIEGNLVKITGAGICHITAYADGDANYYDASPKVQQLSISKASQLINFDRIEDKTYGDPSFILTATNSTGNEVTYQSENPQIISINGNIATIRGAGSVKLKALHNGNDNYLPESAEIIVKVNKATLIAKADDQTRIYGDNNPNLTISYSGFVNGDGVAELRIKPIAITNASIQSNVGSYNITIDCDSDSNYSIIIQNGILTVEKAPIDIIAQDVSRLYGESNPDFTYKITGFRNGDDERDLFSPPYLYTNAKSSSSVGTYEIFVEGSDARNYKLNYIPGKLIVEKAPLVAQLLNSDRIYGDDNKFSIVYDGFRNLDNESVILSEPEIITDADQYSDVGNYKAILVKGDAVNYYFEYTYEQPDNAVIQVHKAELKITAEDKSIFVGEHLPIFTMIYEGFRNGDSEADLDKYPYISAPDANADVIGEYLIILEGGFDNNYEYKLINGVLKVEDVSGIQNIITNNEFSSENVDVFTVSGICLFHNVDKEVLNNLSTGIYIVREGNIARKIIVK